MQTAFCSSSSNSTTGAKALFSGNFTMVKPDGSQTHEHSVSDFRSNNVIIAGGDMIITGIGNIYENAELTYKVPITVHLMGKEHVHGLIIDTVKTDRHFVSNHEMFGTLIKGHWLRENRKDVTIDWEHQRHEHEWNGYLGSAKMHLDEGIKALQGGDQQGALMHLGAADQALGGSEE